MDKWQALDTFWNSFGLPAYDSQTVPDDAVMPYITYEAGISDFDSKMPLTASVWYNSTRWLEVSQKAKEIENAIGGGYGVEYEDGRLWVTKANAFAQRLSDTSSRFTRRIVLQIEVEYQ